MSGTRAAYVKSYLAGIFYDEYGAAPGSVVWSPIQHGERATFLGVTFTVYERAGRVLAQPPKSKWDDLAAELNRTSDEFLCRAFRKDLLVARLRAKINGATGSE